MTKTPFPYPILPKDELISMMNRWGDRREPFFFAVDFNAENGYFIPAAELDQEYIRFDFSGSGELQVLQEDVYWKAYPVSSELYKEKFDYVQQQLHQGNSFLVNLTQPTLIETNLSLEQLYGFSTARYKLWLRDQFVVLSPESFVQISDGHISTFPMKGTIDASLPDAKERILSDEKELAEHATIVDLLRNDLSIVADEVEVKRYRYVERISTLQRDLLQVSSEISGRLPEDYLSRLGEIVFQLLPAGSISGAPKPKTLDIIRRAEGYERGFYTGVCGYFDGDRLDSAVMIRFIEQTEGGLVYKSGGGITFRSVMDDEYRELIQKIYVPLDRKH